ncbi:MAG: Gfo/Idh/MocA family oxidoreductase, partial [Phycisphaerales bacterium]|nr:Gfo/Idh/MocA family oxidoreductase [Phycisphaerales bacterium]
MPQEEQSTRRDFLKAAAASGAAATLLGSVACAPRDSRVTVTRRAPIYTPKIERLRIAYIGTNGIGNYHLEKTRELGITCPCFCDVDTDRMGKAVEFWPGATRYQDYRKMFEREAKNFDAVMVGTPDHHHYPATLMAMKLGKHVYTQKPLTHTVWEARELAKAAQTYPVVTQMGNQGHANEGNRITYEWIRGGFIGDVLETHTWTDRPVWPQGMGAPEETNPVPPNLDWDSWIGVAPK